MLRLGISNADPPPSPPPQVGQTSLLWRPIQMIRETLAAMVARPPLPPVPLCAAVLHSLSRARRAPIAEAEARALRAAIDVQHALGREHVLKLRRLVTPLDLPLLCRRLQLLLHVQGWRRKKRKNEKTRDEEQTRTTQSKVEEPIQKRNASSSLSATSPASTLPTHPTLTHTPHVDPLTLR